MNQKYYKSIGVIVIFIVAMLLLFNVSAIIGGIVYLIAFGVSLRELKGKVAYEETFSIMKFIKNIKKDTLLTEGVFTIIVAILPIIVIIATYRWIVVDTIREVDKIYDMF